MIDFAEKELFLYDSTKQDIKIVSDDEEIVITNKELHFEQFHISESICNDEQLTFGSSEASMLKFTVSNVFKSMKGKWLTVSSVLNGISDTFVYGRYKVYSDTPSADKRSRDIVAYDILYDIVNSDVAQWYNTILPNSDSKITLREFRRSFCAYFGVEEEETTLCNDDMVVEKTIEPSEISGKDVIFSICEINGCFANINRKGQMQYIVLQNTSKADYPSEYDYPSDNLFPGSGNPYLIYDGRYKTPKTTYPSEYDYPSNDEYPVGTVDADIVALFQKDCTYDDFVAKTITKVQLRKEENDIGGISGSGDNCYVVQDNFLLYGKGAEELSRIAESMLAVIREATYIPFKCSIRANPCLEVGDSVNVYTKDTVIQSYVLNREISGIQYPFDEISAKGKEKYDDNLNAVSKSIIELKGKGNILTRTVEETRSYIYDTEKKLSSEIVQNANEIALRVRKDRVISEINLTPETITISASRIDLVGIVNADTFISNLINAKKLVAKFATLEKLNADMVDVAGAISAVDAKFGSLNASNITSGTMSADRLDINGLINSQTFRGASLTVYAVYATTGFTYQGIPVKWGEINGQRVLVPND